MGLHYLLQGEIYFYILHKLPYVFKIHFPINLLFYLQVSATDGHHQVTVHLAQIHKLYFCCSSHNYFLICIMPVSFQLPLSTH
jgi:hypothetical protein